jgi:hypothetical protein
MSFADRVGMYLFALTIGAIMGVWGLWVQKNDMLAERLYICAHKNINEHGMGTEEAYVHCSRERHSD